LKKEFIHLHNHTEYSLLDGCGKIDDFVAKAHDLGQSHFAVTEHGSMRSFYKLTIACKKHGKVKPAYGIEFYMSSDMEVKSLPDNLKARIKAENPKGKHRKIINAWERRLAIRPRYHMCAFAKDNDGLRNLFRLSSLSWTKGFFHRPRIDKQALLDHRGGFMVTSACVAGSVPQLLLEGDFAGAVKEAEWWKANFGDDFYLELMPHTFPDQLKLTPMIVKLAKALDIKLIATNDCHYINEANAVHQQILLCIQTNDKMHNPKRFKFDTDEFWMKTYEEMSASFGDHHEIDDKDFHGALENTMEVIEKCKAEVVLDKFKCLLPPIEVPDDINKRSADEPLAQSRYLQRLCMEGWDWRDLDSQIKQKAANLGIDEAVHVSTYTNRLKLELAAIGRQKFSGYFIIVHELFKWCRQEGIMVGPGRGSSAGSLVCYLLGITALDPIEHGLLFERFLNPARIDMPDIDMDFEDAKRHLVIQYLRDKYGTDNCAQIGTVVQMKGKMCLRDVCRVMDVPANEVGAVANSIIERSSGDERASQTILDSFKEFEVCKAFDQRHPDILPIVQQLEGQTRQTGMHAAGVLTSPVPIRDIIPIETREATKGGGRVPVAAIDFWGCEDMGLLKLDILGLRTLSEIRDALNIIKDRHNADIDLERLPVNDPKVLDNFSKRYFAGIFQFDTTAMYNSCENITFTGFEDIGAMCALNRPGTMRSGLNTQYVDRKNDPKKRVSIHPIYDKICEETQGVLVYQEQLTRIFIEMAGYEPATADSLRKLVAKKHGEEAMGKEREKFIKGAAERGVPADVADRLMQQITFFGSYAFNKSHSYAYGTISYWCMFLKTYYPVEWMWAVLKNEPQRQEVTRFVKATKKMGIDILGPDINESGVTFKVVGDKIRCSLLDIKGVGEKAIQEIIDHQPYKSASDMLQRVDRKLVKRNVVVALAQAGALDNVIPNVKHFIDNVEHLYKFVAKTKWDEFEIEVDKGKGEPDFTENEKALLAVEVSPLPMGTHPMEAFESTFKLLGKNVKFAKMDDPNLYDKDTAYFAGQIVDIRYNQVGDFHSGDEPDAHAKKKMKWGARYANFNVEDVTGNWQRMKLDVDSFPVFRPIIDKGIGTPVVLRAQLYTRGQWKTIKVYNMANLSVLHKKLKAGEPLTYWEQYFVKHPVLELLNGRKASQQADQRGRWLFTGLIIATRHTIDKNGNQMAFFELDVGRVVHKVVCFQSAYPQFKDKLKNGLCGVFGLSKTKTGLILDDSGSIDVVKSYSWKKAK
jgi:DNA polymerase-3 subunit alpha